MARELPEFFVAPAIIAWTGGTCSTKAWLRQTSSFAHTEPTRNNSFGRFPHAKDSRMSGKTLKKFSEIASAVVGTSRGAGSMPAS
jgi:hypothetical protein